MTKGKGTTFLRKNFEKKLLTNAQKYCIFARQKFS